MWLTVQYCATLSVYILNHSDIFLQITMPSSNFDSQRYAASESSYNNRTLSVSYYSHKSGSANIAIKLISSDSSENGLQRTQVISVDKQEILEELSERLQTFLGFLVQVEGLSGNRTQNALSQLRSIGIKLCDLLIPTEIANRIATWEEGCFIEVMTDEHWIPWDLFCSKKQKKFWGERFVLSRKTCITRQKLPRGIETRKIFNAVGGDLGDLDSTQAVDLFQSSALLDVTQLKHFSCDKIIEALNSKPFDVLHITCHGRQRPFRLQTTLEDQWESALSVERIETELELGSGCFVFANACNSAREVTGLFNEDTSFGHAFCKVGASAFLGTLGTVPTKYALELAPNIYADFLPRKDNNVNNLETAFNLLKTIGYAFSEAKRKASQQQNMFWLLYSMHGDFFHIC